MSLIAHMLHALRAFGRWLNTRRRFNLR